VGRRRRPTSLFDASESEDDIVPLAHFAQVNARGSETASTPTRLRSVRRRAGRHRKSHPSFEGAKSQGNRCRAQEVRGELR
jgi:hypothetical protein